MTAITRTKNRTDHPSGAGRGDGIQSGGPAALQHISMESARSLSEPDLPIGRTITVPSGITGKALSYFIPDPLPDLLERYCWGSHCAPSRKSPYCALLLLRAAARSSDGQIDPGQAHRFFSIMLGQQGYRVNDLVDLGRSLSRRVTGIRNETVFVGAQVASFARHIYAPHTELPRLIHCLESALASLRDRSSDPLIASAIVGMYCAFVHPFVDANGRWARLIAFLAGRCVDPQSGWRSMAASAFMNCEKLLLSNALWPSARDNGARTYLAAVETYERQVGMNLQEIGAFQEIDALVDSILKTPDISRTNLHVIAGVIATGRLPINAVRSCFGLSQRAATARFETAAATICGANFNGDELDLSSFVQRLDDVTGAASAWIY